jgi:hypothetical protein
LTAEAGTGEIDVVSWIQSYRMQRRFGGVGSLEEWHVEIREVL